MSEHTEDAEGDDTAFWRMGSLPEARPEARPETRTVAGAGTGPERLARPDITVDGRNLADVLAPAYRAMTSD